MQSVHHVVMTACKRPINSGRLVKAWLVIIKRVLSFFCRDFQWHPRFVSSGKTVHPRNTQTPPWKGVRARDVGLSLAVNQTWNRDGRVFVGAVARVPI